MSPNDTWVLMDRCILCCEKPCNSYEHLIPQMLGGTLELKILCHSCNKRMGSEVVSEAKNDLSIRLAIQALKDEIPKVYKDFEEGQPYIGITHSGDRIEFKKTGNQFKPRYTKLEKSEIVATSDGIRNLKREMMRDSIPDAHINIMIDKVHKMPIGQYFPIYKDIVVAKPSMQKFDLSYKHDAVSDRFPVLIAYEFLAMVLGDLIYDWYFDSVRSYLLNSSAISNTKIERFSTNSNGYRSIHSIMIEISPDSTAVDILLFDWVWYRVAFQNLVVNTKPYVYRDLIPIGQPQLAESKEMAQRQEFLDLHAKYPLPGGPIV